MRRIALIGVLVMATAGAQQAPETVFGMQLGAPLAIPECQTEGWPKAPKAPDTGACYVRDAIRDAGGRFVQPTAPLSNDGLEIRFAFNNRPAIATGRIRASLKNGNLASVIVFTGGMASEENDLRLLTEKYGAPTHITRPSYQNGFGAKYEGVQAEWELPTGTFVRLESPDETLMKLPSMGGPNVGTLRIQTAAVHAENQEHRQAEDAQRTQL